MAETTTDGALPEGSLISVFMEISIPCQATPDQIREWLRYEVGSSGPISRDNPLHEYAPEVWGAGDVEFTDSGMIGRSEEYGHQPMPGGGQTYNVRYSRTWRALDLSTAVEG